MRATHTLPRSKFHLLTLVQRLSMALLAASLALLASAALFVIGVRVAYAGRALPGVSAAGVNLAGMNQAEMELALGQALSYPQTGLMLLRDGDRLWPARPADLGVVLDIPSMARRALAVGRQGGLAARLEAQFDAWYEGHAIPPLVIFDQRVGAAFLQTLAEQIDQPQLEATLGVNGLEIMMRPGQIGRRLDVPATLEALTPSISRLHDTDLALVVKETPPLVLDASDQAAIAREILSQPLTLTAEGAGPWVFDPPSLAAMLTFNLVEDEGSARYQVGLDPEVLTTFLEPLAPSLEREPVNARFIFNDDTRQLDLLQPAVIGRQLDIPGTIEAINQRLADGQHEIPLLFHITEPAVRDDATAADLGITQAVSVVSTYFAGSSSARIQNIKTASSAFHGLLVAPGETLSMADVLGDISLDNGYAEALIIYGNRTIKGVGGGVCQVSTTLFRAVFFGGYPIVVRYPHAYRVGYYEQGPGSPGPGLDATVFVPLVDFKFTNDTPYWLLMETYIYGNQLLWKFYSTSDGRTVQWSRHVSNEVEAPEPLYTKNPDLPKGKIKQVDWAADGMDVVVYRTVSRSGEVLYKDTIKTHYLPWRAIYEYGPGTKLPKDAKTE
jgi:vancomycin resistance protein YoaR